MVTKTQCSSVKNLTRQSVKSNSRKLTLGAWEYDMWSFPIRMPPPPFLNSFHGMLELERSWRSLAQPPLLFTDGKLNL